MKTYAIRSGKRWTVSALLGGVLLAACGAGSVTGADATSATGVDESVPEVVDAPTETTSFHYSPVLCSLPVLLRRNHGVVLGTVLEMEGPLVGSPFDAPDREYWVVTLAVESVVPGSLDYAPDHGDGGNPLPPLEVGGQLTFVLYPDLEGTPVDSALAAMESASRIMAMLGGIGEADRPDEPGVRFAYRLVSLADVTPRFEGACSEELSTELAAIGDALGREASEQLLVDFQAEVLGNRETDEGTPPPGPIEATAYSLYDTGQIPADG